MLLFFEVGEALLRDGVASSTGLHHEKKMTYFNIHEDTFSP